MKRYLLIGLLLVAGFAGYSLAEWTGSNKAEQPEWIAQIVQQYPELQNKKAQIARVKRVIDGDTFVIATDERVRLIGVNTPEVSGTAQYYGQEAAAYSRTRLTDQTVYLFKDVSETDRYGRLLRYVFIKEDVVMFNETLLTEGYANTMTIQPDASFADKFVQVERTARAKNKGLWGKQGEQDPATTNATTTAACAAPAIKGNINSRKEKIYHVPGGQSYAVTVAEEMFCTEEDAVAAGFRKAGR